MAKMCPLAVLNGEQKKVRFQRMIRKREIVTTTLCATKDVLPPSQQLQQQQPQLLLLQQQKTQQQNLLKTASRRISVRLIDQNLTFVERPVVSVAKRGHSIALEAPSIRKMPRLEPIKREPSYEPTGIKTPIKMELEPERETDFWPDFLTSKVEFLLRTFEKSFEDQLLMKDHNASFTSGQIFRSIFQNAKQFQIFAHLQRYFFTHHNHLFILVT
jgi:hypothetical protein